MTFTLVQLGAILGLAATARAHFVLMAPTSIGFDDAVEDVAPCGSFNPTDRSAGVTDWPIGGQSISVITTHLSVKWTIRAALISDPTNFVSLVPVIDQTGVGSVCFDSIPGRADWAGKDAVLQIYQEGTDGILYQCAAIKFVEGGAAPVPADCSNDTGVTWEFETPPPSSTTTTTTTKAATTTTAAEQPNEPSAPSSTTTSAAAPYSPPSEPTTTGYASGVTSTAGSSIKTTTAVATSTSKAATTSTASASPSQFTGSADRVRAGLAAVVVGAGSLFAWLI